MLYFKYFMILNFTTYISHLESLLVIASLGLQLTTTFVTGRKASQFILREDISDVIINEGIFMVCTIFYYDFICY